MSDGHCYACLEAPRADDPSIADEYLAGIWCHLRCLNSDAAKAWRSAHMRVDPGYARYWRMSSTGLGVRCEACGSACLVSAKARGMDAAGWEVCCSKCHRISELNGYAHREAYEALRAAEARFLRDAADESWRDEVRKVADSADPVLDEQRCTCGGRFSVAAPPRCPTCRHVLLESYFHYAFPRTAT